MIAMRTAAIPFSTAVSRVPLMISRRMCQECRAYRGKSERWKLKPTEPAKVKTWLLHELRTLDDTPPSQREGSAEATEQELEDGHR